MARIRTFIAVDPGKPIRDHIVALQEELATTGADVKWVEPDNLHLTLLFLGEVDNREVLDVCRAVQRGAGSVAAFTMSVEGVGCFPNMRRPRNLWVGLGPGRQEMIALHDTIEKLLLELGCYRREAREFTPHITLGRTRSENTRELAAALQKRETWKAGATSVHEVLVMSSDLTPQGPQYTILSRAKLM